MKYIKEERLKPATWKYSCDCGWSLTLMLCDNVSPVRCFDCHKPADPKPKKYDLP